LVFLSPPFGNLHPRGYTRSIGLTAFGLCVIMLHMKTATVRQIQHHLSEVLRWLEQGQEVQITKRNRVIARIVPARDQSRSVIWPDFVERSAAVWGKRPRGKSISRLIVEDREERL